MLTTTSEDDAEDAETNLENNFGLIGTTNKRLRHSPNNNLAMMKIITHQLRIHSTRMVALHRDRREYALLILPPNLRSFEEERRGSNSVRVEDGGKACDRREGESQSTPQSRTLSLHRHRRPLHPTLPTETSTATKTLKIPNRRSPSGTATLPPSVDSVKCKMPTLSAKIPILRTLKHRSVVKFDGPKPANQNSFISLSSSPNPFTKYATVVLAGGEEQENSHNEVEQNKP
ncbi:hypothetical protein BLNAU_18389 [Blattamonas nauphoetae]|uniref:Uncharacterized protein n=1 Tax=Blattamonas nauphoetae TaxID=2049346 RepID=A0ABQ9X4U3_9EUKA|nr:hypothetical protein BLNAU_18389 [Blattamonas nauphoetae]